MCEVRRKELEIYEFLKEYTEEKGYPPAVRDICEAVSLKSTSTVHRYLKELERKGFIKRDPSKPRALEITELCAPKKEMINIPIVGKITAGLPILATENVEDTFPLPIDYIKHDNELFMLRVSGESMINAGINDNDLAIIESTNSARNGEIVVALIEDCVTIKRFFKEKNHIRLQPENYIMAPIILKECKVLGKLVGIYRSYR